jgi:hypothetical protein
MALCCFILAMHLEQRGRPTSPPRRPNYSAFRASQTFSRPRCASFGGGSQGGTVRGTWKGRAEGVEPHGSENRGAEGEAAEDAGKDAILRMRLFPTFH